MGGAAAEWERGTKLIGREKAQKAPEYPAKGSPITFGQFALESWMTLSAFGQDYG
jgi:hypothetical protein